MTKIAALLFCLVWTVARVGADKLIIDEDEAYNNGTYGSAPTQTFISSDITAPLFHVRHWDKARSSLNRFLFMAPKIHGERLGPWIFSSHDMSLVYADPRWKGGNDCAMQMHYGKPYLTLWYGRASPGFGDGYSIMFDENYRLAYNITAQNLPNGTDPHEFQLTGDGGALVTNYHTITRDARPWGGPDKAELLTGSFQEIDVDTGRLRFTWNALDHFDPSDRLNGAWDVSHPKGYDWFHLNSLQKTKAGDYLISSRWFWMIALISGEDGRTIWQLGGKNNMFRDLSGGKALSFKFQHHARFIDDDETEITLFSNQILARSAPTPGCDHDCSRGMHIRIDTRAMTVDFVRQYPHPLGVQSWAEGGLQHLPNGHALVNWGFTGGFSEFAPDGQMVLDVQNGPWPKETTDRIAQMYRVLSFDWVGRPTWPPSIATEGGYVYVSWNGATEVARWRMYSGKTSQSVRFTNEVPRAGFETRMRLPEGHRHVKAEALDIGGEMLGSSQTIEAPEVVVDEQVTAQNPLGNRGVGDG